MESNQNSQDLSAVNSVPAPVVTPVLAPVSTQPTLVRPSELISSASSTIEHFIQGNTDSKISTSSVIK